MHADDRGATSGTDAERRADGDASRGRARGAAFGAKAGFVATVVMSAFRRPISRSPPPTAWLWAEYVAGGNPEEHEVPGMVLHLCYGTAAGGVFGSLLAGHLNGSDANRELRGAALGVVYGVLLSVFGVAVLLKRVLGMDLDDDERLVFHLSHVVYGLTLGTWLGSRA